MRYKLQLSDEFFALLPFESEEEALDFANDVFKTALDEAPWDFDNYGDEMVYVEER
jgi:hypothetical protein